MDQTLGFGITIALQIEKGVRDAWNSTADHSDSCPARGAPDLGLQFGMGLFSQRWLGTGFFDRRNLVAYRPPLIPTHRAGSHHPSPCGPGAHFYLFFTIT